DMVIETYISESVLLRTQKKADKEGKHNIEEYIEMMKVYIHDAADKINKAGKEALFAFVEGDDMRIMQIGMKRFTKTTHFNTKQSRRKIVKSLIEKESYCF
ncbi:MAG: acyl-CoA dehydrogenase, partial [Flavobacteriales bacterium]